MTPIMGFAARSVRGPIPIAQSLFRHLAATRSGSRDGARVGQIRAVITEQRCAGSRMIACSRCASRPLDSTNGVERATRLRKPSQEANRRSDFVEVV